MRRCYFHVVLYEKTLDLCKIRIYEKLCPKNILGSSIAKTKRHREQH